MASGGGSHFLQEDIATFNNKKLVDSVVPEVIARIIEWGCKKDSNETFWDFIVKRHAKVWNKYKKRWGSTEDQKRLMETGCETFDVTFLIKLVPEICDDIDPTGTKSWSDRDDSRVESLLQQIKDLRNLVMHDPSRTAISSTVIYKVQEVLLQLLRRAGVLYGKPKEEVTHEIDNVKRMVRRVQETLVNPRQQSIFDVQHKLAKDCRNEIRDVWENVVNKEVLPFCKVKVVRSDVFHPITLEIPNEYDERPVQFKCEQLFQKWPEFDDKVNCIVIEGMAGSGKTTLVKRIALDYVSDGDKVFQGVDNYSLMIHMECRNPNVETLPQVLLRNFPRTLQSLCIDEVISAVQSMRVLLFIDGIDERNAKSRILVNDVLDYFGLKQDSMLIFTSRPNSSKAFRNELDEKSINYQALNIKKISLESEQIEFLDRYQTAIPGINPPELIKAFQTLKYELQSHFVYPIFLTLFCHLFRESPTDVNAWTSQRNVMQQTLKLCSDKMVQRISVVNSQLLASKIIDAVCDLSFRCLGWEQMSIDQTTFNEFCNECRKNIDPNIDYYSITSCILLIKCPYYSTEEDSYCFFHRSQQEHLASRSVISRLRNPQKSVREAIREIMGPYPFAPEDFNKIVMALKFTILEYDTVDKQRRLGNHRYTELLELLQSARLSSFEDWAQIVCNFPNCELVERVASEAAADEDGSINVIWWEVTNSGQVSAATRMLRHHQPLAMKIKLPASWVIPPASLVTLLEAVGRYHSGGLVLELHHHFATYTPADDALLHLSNGNCGMVEFHGCLSTVGAAKALAVATGTSLSPGLHISLPYPYQHPLMELQNTRHGLYVTVQHCRDGITDGNPAPKPLPRGSSPPQLTIADTPRDGVDEAEALFLCLAPEDKRYYRMQLRSCQLTDEDLRRMLNTLYSAGLYTEDSDGESRWEDAGTLSGECRVCFVETRLHNTGCRCIWLHLTGDALAAEHVGKDDGLDADEEEDLNADDEEGGSSEKNNQGSEDSSEGSRGTTRASGGISAKNEKDSDDAGNSDDFLGLFPDLDMFFEENADPSEGSASTTLASVDSSAENTATSIASAGKEESSEGSRGTTGGSGCTSAKNKRDSVDAGNSDDCLSLFLDLDMFFEGNADHSAGSASTTLASTDSSAGNTVTSISSSIISASDSATYQGTSAQNTSGNSTEDSDGSEDFFDASESL